MKVAASSINRRGRGVLKAISVPTGVQPVLTREYQAILKNNGKPMVIVDEDTTIFLANAEFTRLSGYTKKEIEGSKRWTEFVAREDRKRMKEYHLLRKSDPMLVPRCFEFRFVDRHGKIKNIVLTIGQIPGTNKSMASLQDVTDRRQAEVTQRAGEERYQTFFENSRDAVYITTRTGAYVDANNAALDLFGYTREEMKKVKARQLYGDPAEARRLQDEIEEKGFVQDFEVRLRKKDGTRMDCLFTVTALRGDDGSILEYQGIARDMTGRKKAEEALRESEAKYRTIFDAMLEGYFEVDLTGNFTFFNKAVSKFFGCSGDELRGLNYRNFTSPEGATRFYQVFGEVYRTGNPAEIDDYEIIKKDGSIGIAEFSVSLLRNAAGKPIGFRGVTRDVSEKRKTEETLQQSEERYRTILDKIEEGYYETDLTGNFTFFNEAICKIHGRSRDELMKMNNREYTSLETAKRIYAIFNEVFRTGIPAKIVDYEMIRKDGSVVMIEMSASLLRNAAGEPIGFYGVSRDRTEQKKYEETLRQSEERYRTMLESIGDSYTETDLSGRLTFINKAVSMALGYSREELIGMQYKDYTPPEEAKKIHEIYNRVYRTGEPAQSVEIVHRAKDGTPRILEATIELKRDKAGKPIGFKTFTRDITERRRTEEALRQSEERYRTILETMQDSYYEIDLAGNYTFVNDAVCRNFGYTKEELIGKKSLQHQDEANAKKTYHAFKEIYRTGEPIKALEAEYTRKDGTKGTYELSISLRRDVQGKPIGFGGITHDITERKQMEDGLRQSEERYRTILEGMQEAYYEIDLGGRFTFVNDAVCKHLGYPREELIGMDNRRFQDETTAKKTYQLYKEVYRTGEPAKALESEYVRKDGTKGTYEVSVSLIRDTHGKPIGFRGVSRDVTERKKAEEQLKRYAAEMERSNEEVKNFAYIVSHDLRVPLVNLKGYTSELRTALEVIGSNLDAVLPHLIDEKQSAVAMALHEDVPEALEFITSSVSRMDSFINSILILSRLGRQDLKPEPIDMNTLVKTTVETMSHQIQERGIEVQVGSLPHVVADRTSMEQIVGNILGNAVKYLDSSRPCRIEVAAEVNNGETIFSIRDTGRGIAAEDMHKVFAPFRRAGKQDTQGEGMGLAYVQTLVRRHGGRIWCESEPGKGTTFAFTISTTFKQGMRDA